MVRYMKRAFLSALRGMKTKWRVRKESRDSGDDDDTNGNSLVIMQMYRNHWEVCCCFFCNFICLCWAFLVSFINVIFMEEINRQWEDTFLNEPNYLLQNWITSWLQKHLQIFFLSCLSHYLYLYFSLFHSFTHSSRTSVLQKGWAPGSDGCEPGAGTSFAALLSQDLWAPRERATWQGLGY